MSTKGSAPPDGPRCRYRKKLIAPERSEKSENNNGKRSTQEDGNGASCQRVDVDIGAVGDAELEFPGGAVMSLHIAPEKKLSENTDRSVGQSVLS